MSALKYDIGDLSIAQQRTAKLLGREPSTITIHRGGFGNFEYVTCPGCAGRGSLNGVACPACNCVGSLSGALKAARVECREAIEAMYTFRSPEADRNAYDGGNRTPWEQAFDRFVLARAEMHAIARAIAMGAE